MAAPIVVVTGANGLVGARMCLTCAEGGAQVRALVRRPDTAPVAPGISEVVGDLANPAQLRPALDGAVAVINTVHPLGADRADQERMAVQTTPALADAAASAGVERFIHVSTCAVYDRSPGVGDVDESSALVADGAGPYSESKRDGDAALAAAGSGITRILLRPPAILGPGATSVWNTLRPASMSEDPAARRAIPEATFAWVHVADLAALAGELALDRIAAGPDPAAGPVAGGCVTVNVVAPGRATQRDYFTAVTGALGIAPEWDDAPGWTGRILGERARTWGWSPRIDLDEALAELVSGL